MLIGKIKVLSSEIDIYIFNRFMKLIHPASHGP